MIVSELFAIDPGASSPTFSQPKSKSSQEQGAPFPRSNQLPTA
jgi:hypothetical protein